MKSKSVRQPSRCGDSFPGYPEREEDVVTSVAEHRQRRYAVHALALGDGTVSGAASLFDAALTNGLLAVVEMDWPGETGPPAHLKSARQLIDLVRGKVGGDRWLIAAFDPLPALWGEPASRMEVDL